MQKWMTYIAVLLLLMSATLHAQIKAKIEHYSTEDGLSHDGVMSMLKDSEGFMWFGTWDGINRYDGHNFITYKSRPGDSSRLKNTRIDNIVEDKSGYLWLRAYDYQIYRFDKKTGTFLAIADILAKDNIHNVIFDKIISTKKGQVWLTTIDQGLFCVKNTNALYPEIIRYNTDLANGFKLPSNNIRFFFEDGRQNIWIGTDLGLCILSAHTAGMYKSIGISSHHLRARAFTCIAESRERIWLGTNSGSLVFYEKSSRQFHSKKISGARINDICISKIDNIVYVSTSAREIITLNTSNLQVHVSVMPGTDSFHSIYEDRSGRLWIEPANHGIIKYDPATKAFRYFFQENDATLNYPVVNYRVFEDPENRIWVSMKGGGFGYYDHSNDKVEYFNNEPGSANRRFSNIVTCIYFDPAGILWLITNDRGIEKIIFQRNDFDLKQLVNFTLNKSDNEIRGVYSDQKNRLWLASKSGKLYIYQNEEKRLTDFFVNEPPEGIGPVYTILQDKKGSVWLGTKGNGLFRADPVDSNQLKYKLTHYKSDKTDRYSLSSNLIYALLEDNKGRIWVGTFEHGPNLAVYKEGQIRFIHPKNEFKNYPKVTAEKIRHLRQDPDGKIWIATTNGLVIADVDKASFGDYQFACYRKNPGDKASLGNNDVQFIFRDSKNRMWVSTSGGGLNKAVGQPFQNLKFDVFTQSEGLPSDYILSIVEDNLGNLWLGTENGLSKFNPDRLHFRNYDSYDGLPKTGFSEASGLKLPNGNLLFGTMNGYLILNPSAIVNKKISAGMAFTNLQINNKDVIPGADNSPLKVEINAASAVDLEYNQNTISIDFTVLDYRSYHKQAYAYRLTDFDEEWTNVLNQHRATYTNLPPGNYVFEVKSLSDDLYENSPAKTLPVNISPPWWRTTWAYILYAVVLIVLIEAVRRIVFTMIRLRNRISLEQKLTNLKINFFTNVSHELRTPLTLIINPLEELLRQENLSVKAQQYLTVARKNTNRMVRFINQLLDFQKVQSGKMKLRIGQTEMVSFVKEISGYFSEAAIEKQIELILTSNVTALDAWVDAEKIDIVIYNLLSNAFKFSPKGKVIEIKINYTSGNDYFTIDVIDQGIGVPGEKLNDIFELYYEVDKTETNHLAGTGIGLALCKEIVTLHHGKIAAFNNAAKGLTVTVELKTGKGHFREDEVIVVKSSMASADARQVSKAPALPIADGEPATVLPGEAPVVLIIDDNRELRTFLADQLAPFYTVAEAENGREGWDKALQLVPDLILSDVMMPEMDGIELLGKLKNNVATSHIPVLLLTAKSSIQSQIEGLNYGADYYITKPFHASFILALIENILKQRKKIFEWLLSGKEGIEKQNGTATGTDAICITSKDEIFLKEVIAIVENKMEDSGFNIDKVAEALLMGRTTFYKKLKSLTNLAPVEFIREIRLRRAKQLLDEGETNISAIAYNVGFSNAKYFSTCFKEKFHLSPSDYLKTRKAGKTLER